MDLQKKIDLRVRFWFAHRICTHWNYGRVRGSISSGFTDKNLFAGAAARFGRGGFLGRFSRLRGLAARLGLRGLAGRAGRLHLGGRLHHLRLGRVAPAAAGIPRLLAGDLLGGIMLGFFRGCLGSLGCLFASLFLYAGVIHGNYRILHFLRAHFKQFYNVRAPVFLRGFQCGLARFGF